MSGGVFREMRNQLFSEEPPDDITFLPQAMNQVFYFDDLLNLRGSYDGKGPIINSKKLPTTTTTLVVEPNFILVHINISDAEQTHTENFKEMIRSKLPVGTGKKREPFRIQSFIIPTGSNRKGSEWKHLMTETVDAGAIIIFDHSMNSSPHALSQLGDFAITDTISIRDLIDDISRERQKDLSCKLPLFGIFSDHIQEAIFNQPVVADDFFESVTDDLGVALFSTSISPSTNNLHFELASISELLVGIVTGDFETWMDSFSQSQNKLFNRISNLSNDFGDEHFGHCCSIFVIYSNSNLSFNPTRLKDYNKLTNQKDPFPKTLIHMIDETMDNIERTDHEACNKILNDIKNICYISLEALHHLTERDDRELFNKVIFSGLMSMKSKFRKNKLSDIDEQHLLQFWSTFKNSKESLIGIQTIKTREKVTEGEIITGFSKAFQNLYSEKGFTHRILRILDEKPSGALEHFEKVLHSRIEDHVPIHKPDPNYSKILLIPDIASTLKEIYDKCKSITHGYSFTVNFEKYQLLYQNDKPKREADLRYLLRKLGDVVEDTVGELRKTHTEFDATKNNLDWYERGESID